MYVPVRAILARSVVMAFASLAFASPSDGAFADDHTVALWLFDEPQYFHMTLTDAGEQRYDLRLLEGGRMTNGHFGGALRVSDTAGPAVAYPCQSRVYDDMGFFSTDSWKIKAPARLVETFSRSDWTLEFWMKLDSAPGGEVTVFEFGTPGHVAVQCTWSAGQAAFILAGESFRDSIVFPARAGLIQDSRWHHLAFIRSSGKEPYAFFLDGRHATVGRQTAPSGLRSAKPFKPGLIGCIFERPSGEDLGKPVNLKAAGQVDFFWGEPRDLAWAESWHGTIQCPRDAEVEFWAEAAGGARLTLGDQLVINGWSNSSARSGRFTMQAGKAYPLKFDFLQLGATRRCRLHWRIPGGDWELVPAECLKHSPEDEAEGLARMKGAIDGRFYLSLGSGWLYDRPMRGSIDELRISDVARYNRRFPLESYSANVAGAHPRTRPNGPPLLFLEGVRTDPLPLGSSKHLFIDEAIVEARHQMRFTANAPLKAEAIDFAADGDCSVYDTGTEIRFMYNNGAAWQGNEEDSAYQMMVSKDGLHFESPRLTHIKWHDRATNNVVLRCPVQGRFIKDTNPNVPPEEQYKFGGFMMHRGVFLFTSPDGIQWRRNETIMSPFDVGGGVEMFWDDQRGSYVCFIRSEGWTDFREPFGRAVARTETTEPFKPWPFQPSTLPAVLTKAWSLPSISTELPVPICPKDIWNPKGHFFRDGQVYRSRALKYAWAPDAYIAFPWRLYGIPDREQRQTDLAVSRDGMRWTFFEAPYFPFGAEYEGEKVMEALSVDGLVRRGDELWQYAHIRFVGHRSGQLNTRRSDNVILRYTQRLDGFVSMDARKDEPGWMVTRPFVFQGSRLELNVASKAFVTIGLLDANGNAIPDFSINECDSIADDSTHRVVTWKGRSDVSRLAGRTVRMRVEMRDAKLFAFQFVK